MINLLLLNNFYRDGTFRKESDELLHTDSVTRYGPQSVCQRKWSNIRQL